MTWSLVASSWFFEASAVLASASFWSTLLLRSSEAPHVEAETGSIVIRQSTEAFRRISFPWSLARAVHTWKYDALFTHGFVPCSLVSGVWVCLRSAESWILREMPWCFWAQCLARLWLLVLSECCLRHRETLWLLPQYLDRQWIHILRQCLAFACNFALFLLRSGVES